MNLTFNADSMMSLAWGLIVAYAVFLIPSESYATISTVTTGGNAIAKVLCNVSNWFTGPVGKGVATLAILVIGVGALMGKVSWGMAIIVGIGIAVIFGAPSLLNDIGIGGNCKT